ncbi:hypothetical protein DC3_11530 [Deinococcus cellulosilyticus NBRC 106333 = KACC 11606]|uniref:HTH cro/C1-type domain-containing protein n=1 Tax=Deinococcus cellulosilyticus (strain DSM 18568 / NBRC 106333 / KACC 11606 / 5516J-15) TaxID=1223518 RepID=A0A511MYZ0_DEIC1|nr:hypothetical protein DC3_11530 [Deinococcus cellulosilyticus NBRC 106333 = KACC 11606]
MNVISILKFLMEQHEITQLKLADATGIDQGNISKLFRANGSSPKITSGLSVHSSKLTQLYFFDLSS